MSNNFDVIVIGGGPAGALTAYHLAAAGVRVVVVDAGLFPREKACGGGVQRRAFQKIPIPCDSAIQDRLSEVSFTLGLSRGFMRSSQTALVSSVLRSDFDHLLLRSAEAAGAVIREGCRVLGVVRLRGSGTAVNTTRGEIRSRFVVGADGANSVVASGLNPRSAYFWQLALYCEVPLELVVPGSVQPARMTIDWGTLPSGYGWVFPKRGTVNVGVGGSAALGKALRPYLRSFVKSLGIVSERTLRHLPLAGHHLPTLTERTRLSDGATILVGDAAGLVEPLTGEGISNACHSAEIAARFLLDALGGQERHSYDERIRAEIGHEIRVARQLLSLAVAFPRALYGVLRNNDTVWNTFCKVVAGEQSFLALRKAIMGRLDCLWAPLQRFCLWSERAKLGLHQQLAG